MICDFSLPAINGITNNSTSMRVYHIKFNKKDCFTFMVHKIKQSACVTH